MKNHSSNSKITLWRMSCTTSLIRTVYTVGSAIQVVPAWAGGELPTPWHAHAFAEAGPRALPAGVAWGLL